MDSFFKVTAALGATNKPNKAAPPPAKGKGAKGKGSVKARAVASRGAELAIGSRSAEERRAAAATRARDR